MRDKGPASQPTNSRLPLKTVRIFTSAIGLFCVSMLSSAPRVSNQIQTPPLPWAPTGTPSPLTPEQQREIRKDMEKRAEEREQQILARYRPFLHQQGPRVPMKRAVREQVEQIRRQQAAEKLEANKAKGRSRRKSDQLRAARMDINHVERTQSGRIKTAFAGFDQRGNPVFFQSRDIVAAHALTTGHIWSNPFNGTIPSSFTNAVWGAGTTISQWDEGRVYDQHAEFITGGQRVVNVTAQPVAVHSTQVGSALIAYGTQPFQGTTIPTPIGMSPRATLRVYSYLDDEFNTIETEVQGGMRLSNHSYGLAHGWRFQGGAVSWRWFGATNVHQQEDYKFGFYSTTSRDFDELSYNNPFYVHVRALGNDRDGNENPLAQPVDHEIWDPSIPDWVTVSGVIRPTDRDADAGGYDTTGTISSAKNILTIGSVQKFFNIWDPTALTGFGPTDDGRIKPDVVAPDNIQVAGTTAGQYGGFPGTSASSALAAGSVNLLMETHRLANPASADMLSSTVRGLVIHTAVDLLGNGFEHVHHPGPDFRSGYGLMNTFAAWETINHNATSGDLSHIKELDLYDGHQIEFTITVPPTAPNPLRATICWTDPPGTPLALALDPTGLMLVNDLDLRLIEPNGTEHFPWLLDPALATEDQTAREAAAITGDNNRDNVEKIVAQNPTGGVWTVRITHKGNITDPLQATPIPRQTVSVIITGNDAHPAPPLEIVSVAAANTTTALIQWSGIPGKNYQLQYRENVKSSVWTDAGGVVNATQPLVAVLANVSIGVGRGFWQVIELP